MLPRPLELLRPIPLNLWTLGPLNLLNFFGASLDLLYILWNLGNVLKGISNLLGLPYYISGRLELTPRVSFALVYFPRPHCEQGKTISTFPSRLS